MKRVFTSLPMIIALATIAAVALMFIIVDDPAKAPQVEEVVGH